jgi:hypothetical protein
MNPCKSTTNKQIVQKKLNKTLLINLTQTINVTAFCVSMAIYNVYVFLLIIIKSYFHLQFTTSPSWRVQFPFCLPLILKQHLPLDCQWRLESKPVNLCHRLVSQVR